MNLKVTAFVISLFVIGCNQKASKSSVKAETTSDATTQEIPEWSETAVLGATDEHEGPVITKIKLEPGSQPISQIFTGGHEFWLFNSNGKNTGLMVFGGQNNYKPYGGAPCSSLSNPDFCDLKPSEMARRCMRQAGNTLDAIKASGNMPDTGGLGFFGWINDGAAIPGAKASGKIWVWEESLIKWVGAVSSDGTCVTPSLSDLKKLLAERAAEQQEAQE